MRWREGRRSTNVEDRRGRGRGLMIGGGLGSVIAVLAAIFLGVDPSGLIGDGGSAPPDPAQDELLQFSSVVLADTEDVWRQQFAARGQTYEEPRLVVFDGAVNSACGYGSSAVGPFYCPGDRQIYVDLQFFRELEGQLGAPGDFARAYVIAHEVGHHVQTMLGISQNVAQASRGRSEAQQNELSVRQELQADCLAGVWAHGAQRMRQVLEPGDIEEALGAASAIGDDTLQRRSQGHVVPDSFTHGSSEQRARWFRRGFEGGSLESCDTFQVASL
jgi:uncharacterized protein